MFDSRQGFILKCWKFLCFSHFIIGVHIIEYYLVFLQNVRNVMLDSVSETVWIENRKKS